MHRTVSTGPYIYDNSSGIAYKYSFDKVALADLFAKYVYHFPLNLTFGLGYKQISNGKGAAIFDTNTTTTLTVFIDIFKTLLPFRLVCSVSKCI